MTVRMTGMQMWFADQSTAISASARDAAITSTTRLPIHGLLRTYAPRGRKNCSIFTARLLKSSSTQLFFTPVLEEKPRRKQLLCEHQRWKCCRLHLPQLARTIKG